MRGFVSLSVAALLLAFPVMAQQAGSPFTGFSKNRDQPINFEADRAEVFDADKKAILQGNVKIVQGESTLTTKRLVIWYEDNNGNGGRKSTLPGGEPSGQTVKRFDMEGGLVVEAKNQRAVAEHGTFDARGNTVVLTGKVKLTQCGNVLEGDKLFADLTANRVRMDSGASSGGRVSGLLNQASQGNPDCAPKRN